MYCKTCKYIREHSGCGINAALLRGDPINAIMLKTGLSRESLTKHRNEHHMADAFMRQINGTKAAKEALDVMEFVKEICEDCRDNAGKAKEKAASSRDFRDASGCWDAATKALSILKPEDKPQVNQMTTVNNYDKLTKEELREAIALAAKLQGAAESSSEKKSD